MPADGSSGIGLVAEIDGFTHGCANWLSGRSIQAPADGSDGNPSNVLPGEAAAGYSGAGESVGPATEDVPSSHGSSNDGGVAPPDPISLGEGLKAESSVPCANTGRANATAEAATRVATRIACRVKLRERLLSSTNLEFISLRTPFLPLTIMEIPNRR